MNKEPVLIIAPFFAPQTHAAMFRVHKLVKYLPKYGYKPIVVTTDINYNYNEDLSLLDEFSNDVEIYRAKYIEPTFRGLRMFLGGKDTTFKAMKNEILNNVSYKKNITNRQTENVSAIDKLKKFVYNMPDAYWTWIYPAISLAKKLIKEKNIKIFYTTVNPNSVLKIGINLKNYNKKLKWVADLRDPVGFIERYQTKNKFFKNYEKKLIQKAMDSADIITGLAASYGNIFKETYNVPDNKFVFIPTGLDDEYLNFIENKNSEIESYKPYLLFVGEFLKEYDDYFFKLMNKIYEKENVDVQILVIGRKDVNYPLIMSYVSNLKFLKDKIKFIDHIPQKKLYQFIDNSKAVLLIMGKNSVRWYCNCAKMVDYIALKKPVISVVPDKSEAKNELDKAGLGIHLTGEFEKDFKILKGFLQNTTEIIPNEEYCKRYLATTQVKDFVKIFEKLKETDEKRDVNI